MPTALPAGSDLTGSSVTEAQFKTQLEAILAALREKGDPLGSFGYTQNLGLKFSVAANALTCEVKQRDGATNASSTNVVAVAFPSSTATSGAFSVRNITGALSLVISSGSTLGHANGTAGKIYWYLIDNAGSAELAASTKYFGAHGIVTTTAEGGAGAADSATVMYSSNVRSNVPFICVGVTTDTQTTAGTWAAAPSQVSLAPIPAPPPIDYSTLTTAIATALGLAILDSAALVGTPTAPTASLGTNSTQIATTAYADAAAAAASASLPTLFVRDEKSSGAAGGTFTQSDWRTRTLNTEKINTISGASLASNRITLPAGTYDILAFAPAFFCASHQARLFNITDSSIVIEGTSEWQPSSSSSTSKSIVQGRFTIAGAKVFELQHYCTATKSGDGFGVPTSLNGEVYAEVRIEKVV